jgi:glucan biosynthesis protein C
MHAAVRRTVQKRGAGSVVTVQQDRIGRHYGLDWLRIAAFALLVPYHVGMYFAPGGWVVHAAERVDWIVYPLALVRPWRLCLLFLVAGYASRALLAKLGDPRAFARSRSLRLLMPLALGVALLVAPETWVRAQEAGHSGSLVHFLLVDRWAVLASGRWTWVEHLWFIDYLWVYTMALVAALLWLPERYKARLAALPVWLAQGQRALLVPLAFVVFGRLSILFVIPQGGDVLTDWHGHLTYVPSFLFGYALAGAPSLWSVLERVRRPAIAIGLLCATILLVAEARWPDGTTPGHVEAAAILAASVAMGWAVPLALAALAERYLNRDHPLRASAAEAVFPFYILHQTVIVWLGWEIRPLNLPFAIAYPLLLGATLAASLAFYLAGREIGWLRPWIGLSQAASRRAPAMASARTRPAQLRTRGS